MTQDQYIENLEKKFERHFAIEKDIVLLGETIDVHARFSSIIGRTFITKKDVIDQCESNEYCYIKKLQGVTEEDVAVFGQFLRKIVDKYVEPGQDHMSTYVTGVLVGTSIDDKARNAIRTYRHSRIYSFYLRGWCDVRLIYIGLDNNEILTNKAGKHVKKVYQITP